MLKFNLIKLFSFLFSNKVNTSYHSCEKQLERNNQIITPASTIAIKHNRTIYLDDIAKENNDNYNVQKKGKDNSNLKYKKINNNTLKYKKVDGHVV